jgi:RES domain-containing protein
MPRAHPLFSEWFTLLDNSGGPLRTAWTGDVFRATEPKWMSRPYRLTGVGAVLAGGRWNVRNLMPAIYFATIAATAAAEADAESIRQGWPASGLRAQTRVPFRLSLQSVVDLTIPATLKRLHVKKSDLTGCDWEADQLAGREALTQAVARAAFENRVEGLVVPSARRRDGANVIVFPTHLQARSSIVAYDEAGIPFAHGL